MESYQQGSRTYSSDATPLVSNVESRSSNGFLSAASGEDDNDDYDNGHGYGGSGRVGHVAGAAFSAARSSPAFKNDVFQRSASGNGGGSCGGAGVDKNGIGSHGVLPPSDVAAGGGGGGGGGGGCGGSVASSSDMTLRISGGGRGHGHSYGYDGESNGGHATPVYDEKGMNGRGGGSGNDDEDSRRRRRRRFRSLTLPHPSSSPTAAGKGDERRWDATAVAAGAPMNDDDDNDVVTSGHRRRPVTITATIAASMVALVLCGKALFLPSRPRGDGGGGGVVTGGGDAGGGLAGGRAGDSREGNAAGAGAIGGMGLHTAVFADGKSGGHGETNAMADASKESLPRFDDLGRYILEDYDAKPTFSDFLPGVAGVYGKPMWAFYVNRGQCIASFGLKSKDYPIMEFSPANKAYQNTATLGFRTFLVGSRGEGSHLFFSEPFSPEKTRFFEGGASLSPDFTTMMTNGNAYRSNTPPLPKRYMYVGSNEVQIREVDVANGIETNATHFILPEEDFGAFVRRTTITNLDPARSIDLSILDGLARMIPAGGELNDLLKNMGRTLEAFFGVYQAHDDVLTMPFYRMSTEAKDSAAVKIQRDGHYLLSFIEKPDSWLLPIVYDSSKVFGEDTMMLHPVGLLSSSVAEILGRPQYGFAKTSSAFAAVDSINLPPGESVTIVSFYGKTDDIMNVPVIARRIVSTGFVQYKFTRAREITRQITAGLETNTRSPLFDWHVQQMYLDNSLRGGIPLILGETDDGARMSNADEDARLKVYHTFSRVHGDLERDYNFFVLEPSFYSEGPVSFRDVAQNRRNDVVFTPRIGSFDLKMFLSFIQADGYQPNLVEAIVFEIKDKSVCDDIAARAVGHADGVRAQRESLSGILNDGPFRPGEVFLLMEQQHIELIMDRHGFVDMVAAAAEITPMAAATAQGFWADHWTYFLDMIESYLSIYPDMERAVMYDERLPYFFSPLRVRPRSEKYVLSLSYDGRSQHVRQLDATVKDEAKERIRMNYFNNKTGWYYSDANWQHDSKGNVFKSSPIAKLFVLASIKFASRDVYSMGIEYEAGKPGWNDAMNGLAGMVGSGMPETYELLVCARYVHSVISKFQLPIAIPIEVASLVGNITAALDELEQSGHADRQHLPFTVPDELFNYWDTVSNARERYRTETALHFAGEETVLPPDEAISIIERWIEELKLGIARSLVIGSYGEGDNGDSGLTPTYFSYDVTRWTLTGRKDKDGHPLVTPNEMKVGRFPLFLEGPVRMMKTVDQEEVAETHELVKKSVLHDEELNMYKVSASLKGQSYDMGRIMAFTPGWLENESVWTHMSYKYYLELIRNGLIEQFYDEMNSGGILPFMKPDLYGRSPLECSSFIASSAFLDPAVRGRGFVARLSGSTAEFLSMWILMFVGPKPFYIDEATGQLLMQLKPALPLWFFEGNEGKRRSSKSVEATISFKLFSSIDVTYHNTERRDLFGVTPSLYQVGFQDGSVIRVDGPVIPSELAIEIRRVISVDCIDVYF